MNKQIKRKFIKKSKTKNKEKNRENGEIFSHVKLHISFTKYSEYYQGDKMKDGETGKGEKQKKNQQEISKVRDSLGDLGVDGKIIFKQNLKHGASRCKKLDSSGSEQGPLVRSSECSKGQFYSIKNGEVLEYLTKWTTIHRDTQFYKKTHVTQNYYCQSFAVRHLAKSVT